MRIWFNKTFSSVHAALQLIRVGDVALRYDVIASSTNPHALVGLAADRFFLEPAGIKGEDYLSWCLETCTKEGVQIFLPGKEATLLSGNRGVFEKIGTRLLYATDKDNLEIINNKQRFYETVRCRIAPPAQWRAFTSLAEFDQSFSELCEHHSSLCIKPAVSVYGIAFRRIRTDRTAFQLLNSDNSYQIDLTSLRTMMSETGSFAPFLLMEYLDGNEYSVDCLADNGLLKCAIARKKPRLSGGGQVIDDRSDIQQACMEIVSQYGLNGIVNIQFREGRDGLRILEVNPRMSGGIAMACLAGPNLPYLGLVGFDSGYENVSIGPIQFGLRVGEFNQATVLK